MGEEFSVLVDFILSGIKVDGSLDDSFLEFSEFGVKLGNSFSKFDDILSFKSCGVIDGIDNLDSEFVQFVDDFLEHALVGEVLF